MSVGEELENEETLDQEDSLRDTLESAFDDDSPDEETSTPAVTGLEGDVETSPIENDNPDLSGETTTNVTEGQAPSSWNPTAREAWASVPPEVQQEISRREKELQNNFNETTQARQLSNSFGQLVSPYQSMFQAQGVDTFTGINNTLQLAAQLQMGTPGQKAQACADIIQQFGVDIGSLDDLLVGKTPQAMAPSPEMQQMQGRMDQMGQYIQNQQYQQQQANQAQQMTINNETEAFIRAKPFANDLRNTMADFMDMSERNGQGKLTLEQAYDRALVTRPDIQQILANRGNSQNNANALATARGAAVSIPQTTGPAGNKPAPTTMRGALEDAWNEA